MANAGMIDNSITTSTGAEVYESDIYSALDSYIADHNGIDIANDMGQYQFKDVLYYIHDSVLNNKRLTIDGYIYNISDVLAVYDIYKRLCARCNKIITIADFSILTGIPRETINGWDRGEGHPKFNLAGSEVHKKLLADSEDSIATMMISTGRNPVGYMAWLNHNYNWATTAAANGQTEARRSPQEIAAAHGVAIEGDNTAVLPPPVVSDDL